MQLKICRKILAPCSWGLNLFSNSCLCFHQEAIETFKEALKLKADFIDAYKSLGQAYRYSWTSLFFFFCLFKREFFWLGHFSNVCAFPLFRELGDFESAMESFQKALLLNQNHIQSLQLRGMMLYHHGSLQEAIGNFKVQKSTVGYGKVVPALSESPMPLILFKPFKKM